MNEHKHGESSLMEHVMMCVPLKAISEQLAAKKDEVADAIRSTQAFLLSKQTSK